MVAGVDHGYRLGERIEDFELQPCAFCVTDDGRPNIEVDGTRLSISGCNGRAAKSCQALVEHALTELRA